MHRTFRPFFFFRTFPRALAPLALAACSQAPVHHTPELPAPLPTEWKTLPELPAPPGWAPADQAAAQAAVLPAQWWLAWQDDTLNALMTRAASHNQSVAAAAASVRQARAALDQQQAALWPTLGLQAGQQRSGGEDRAASGSASAGLQASWAPDLWGRAADAASAQSASVQASQADLAAALLAARGSLANAYFSLRATDAELALLDEIIRGYERSAAIAQRRYDSGLTARTDALQAQSTLDAARASRVALLRNRALSENAIATLTGQSAASFRLAPAADLNAWQRHLPALAPGQPAALLLRRPDVAAAERAVAAANARIGVARAAWFPSLTLSASASSAASRLSDVISAPKLLWSLGASLAQTLLDAGARSAAEQQALAAHEQASAQYRQRALTAMQEVQDQLATLQTLQAQHTHSQASAEVAERIEQQMLARYRSGLVAYTEVVNAQASAQNARRSLMQLQLQRQQAFIALAQALGGGWQPESAQSVDSTDSAKPAEPAAAP